MHKTFTRPAYAETLYNYLQRNFPGADCHSVYAAGFSGFWTHYKLKEMGINNIVINPDLRNQNPQKKLHPALKLIWVEDPDLPSRDDLRNPHSCVQFIRLVSVFQSMPEFYPCFYNSLISFQTSLLLSVSQTKLKITVSMALCLWCICFPRNYVFLFFSLNPMFDQYTICPLIPILICR